MSRRSNDELVPRNGHTLRVLIRCRISGCQKQKELSLSDQEDNAREFLAEIWPYEVHVDVLSNRAKGERLDTPELAEIERAYRQGLYDLVIYDDLSRLIRGGKAVELLGLGVDNGTRSISINDGIDTAEPTWEEDALKACSENVAHNERTSLRVKQKTMNRFKRFGTTPKRPIAGYVVPDDATSFDDWRKEDPATWIHEGRKKLLELKNYTAVSDFFNGQGIPVGPACYRNLRWTGEAVNRFFSNPILKGQPYRGRMHTVKKHEVGRRVSLKNPKGPKYYPCPNLAHFTDDEYHELEVVMAEIAAEYKPKMPGYIHRRRNVPRKRTRFPGQFSVCWYCGRRSVWGGNGRTDNLMCNGSRFRQCWNSFGFSGAIATSNVVAAVFAELDRLQGFDQQFSALVHAALDGDSPELERRRQALHAQEGQLAVEMRNVQEALRLTGPKPMVLQALGAVEQQETKLLADRRELERLGGTSLELPKSIGELRRLLTTEIAETAQDSPEFGTLLQKVVAEFHVYLVRLCDAPTFYPRAKVILALDGFAPDLRKVCGVDGLFRRELTIDLFQPPQRVRILRRAVELAGQDLGPKAIAGIFRQEGEESPSNTTVQKALKLDRLMRAKGLATPFEFVAEPCEAAKQRRRHQHPAYRFEPLEGYVPPTL